METGRKDKIEKLLWSIALPGFGQILNGSLLKGILIIGLELLVNVQANFNKAIISSFNGHIQRAIEQTEYQWLMFYPCLYMFAVWDAYRDAGGGKRAYSFMPFAFGAYFLTVGLIYSSTFKIAGMLFGPVWLPMLALIPGVGVGLLLQ